MTQKLAGAITGDDASPHQAQWKAAHTPSNQPGRSIPASAEGLRQDSASARRHSVSMFSGIARWVPPVTGAGAANHGPFAGRTVAPASQRHTSANPATYQSTSAPSSSRRSTAAQTAANSSRPTRRFGGGIRATSTTVTSMPSSSRRAPTVPPGCSPKPADLHRFLDSPAEPRFVLLGTGWGQRSVLRRSRSAAALYGQDGGPGA